jgi:hypothetical protein
MLIKQKAVFLITLSTLVFSSFVNAEKAPDEVKTIIPAVSGWGSEQVLIDAVKAQNGQGMSLDDIKARDAAWRKVDGLDAEMEAMMSSDAANKLAELEKSASYFFEVFLMDNQGANVAMTNKTSDYWQGDEAKWQESFKGGTGAVHIGDVEFDESAQAYLVQVSVPVMEGGAAIGAITIGVNLDDLEAQ